jgi:hypothetical protein
LLDKFNGDVEKVKQFMQTVGPIKDVRQQLIDLTGKKSFAQVKKDNLATDPEWNDTEVLPGSILIFGPKIGAFYSNLSGLGGTPTIDRWCIRTMYRYRGDMMAKVLPVEMERFKQENGLEGQSDGSVISLVEAHAKLFNDILAGKGEFKGMSKADRNNALKPYRKGSQIAAKITNVVNEISDGLNEKIGNKAQYSKDFRSFTKKVFEDAQKKIKEQTGQDLQISDIQAILWIYEKELFGAMGVNQRPDSTYSSASQRLVDSIKSGVNTVEDFKNGKAKTDQKSAILEEGPMGDLIPMDAGDYMEGLEDQPDRLNEDEDIQNSVPREGDRIGKYDQLPGAPTPKGATGPIPELVDVAETYAKNFGIPYTRQAEYVQVDEEFATRTAKAYEEMKHDPKNPKVKEAFADLIRQTTDQYNALMDAGYQFTFFEDNTDPYDGNPVDAMRDLRNNKRMAVYGTYSGYGTEGVTGANVDNNPMLAPTGLQWPDQAGVMRDVTANDLFRAVHDAFGHGLEGAGFRARGEENAWQAHARLFTGPAVAAITSETRGQNSWLNYGPHGEHNRKATLKDTIFAEQKTGLMPEWTWTENVSPAMEEPKGDQRISDALDIEDVIQPSAADRGERTEYTQALDEMGFTEEQIEDWRKENKVSQRQERTPGVQESAQAVYEGKKNVYEYIETVRELQPIKPFTKVPKIPSFLDVVASLKSDQVVEGIIGLTKSIEDGTRVGLRLDIPAYDFYDTWVVSLHDGTGDSPAGKKIAYGKTGVIRNVNFVTSSTGSLNIARGKSNKQTIARMFGDWINESPELSQARAEQLMNDPNWVQVGMNPFRHSWFYDKNDGMPLTSAEEVIQVGALVLAKNPRKLDLNDETDRAEFEERFKVKTPTGDIVQFSDASRYEKSDIPDLIERAMNGIDADLAKGISLEEAIQRNITNQPWYSMVNDRQRKSIQSVIESTYDEEIASMAAPEAAPSEPTVKSSVAALAAEVERLYYEVRDGSRSERVSAKARIEQMLLGNPKLSYIYKNISLINEQLETRGLLTKSIGCP